MFNRRSFVVCACAGIVAHGRIGSASAQVEADAPFVCATIEPMPQTGDSVTIINFSTAQEQTDVEVINFNQVAEEFNITPFGMRSYAYRWRKSDSMSGSSAPIVLGVYFVDGTDLEREFFRTHAAAWMEGELGKLIEFRYVSSIGESRVRVGFEKGDGNWSYIGNQANNFPGQKTMNIDNLTRRVVLHECGHCLGLLHEHVHPDFPLVWNENAILADLSEQGWTLEMVRSNITERLDRTLVCVNSPVVDYDSIMMYGIQPNWNAQSYRVVAPSVISDLDRRCLRGVYSADI